MYASRIKTKIDHRLILYLIVIGFCIGSGMLAHARGVFPGFQKQLQSSSTWAKLQQYVFLPALFRSRRLEPLPGKVGYIPGRMLSISIAVYIVINIILSSVSFRGFSPNTWFTSPQFEMCEYVGNRTGTLSLVNMTIAILFAGRNNILIAITGWNQTAFLTLHRWAARVSVLQAVVHSIAYTLAYFEPGSGGAARYATEAAKPFYVCPVVLRSWRTRIRTISHVNLSSANYFILCFTVVGNHCNNSTLPCATFCNLAASNQVL